MNENPPQDDLRALMLRHLEGGASADEVRGLSAVLRESAEARRDYVALARQHAQLFEIADERKVVALDQPRFEARTRSHFRWPRLAWAAVLVALAGFAIVFFANRTGIGQMPRIASLQGEVVLFGPAGERALTSGDPWRLNEGLRTAGGRSTVTLKFADGSQLAFAPNSMATNESSPKQKRIRLEHGNVQASIKAQPTKRPFVFATPHAEGIVVGTTLRVFAEDRFTRLEVISGQVRFRRVADGAEVTVNSGEYALAAPDTPLAARPIR